MSRCARIARRPGFQFGCTSERTRPPQIAQVFTISRVTGARTMHDGRRLDKITIRQLTESASWAAPLPDFSEPAINHRIRIGAHVFRIVISAVQREVPREPRSEE